MRHNRKAGGVAAAAALLVALGVGPALASANFGPGNFGSANFGPGSTTRIQPAAEQLPGSAPSVLTLITGERVLTGSLPGGPRIVSILGAPGDGPAGSLAALRAGGRYFVIPLEAIPYIGRGLDLSLFDLASLRQAERDGRLPLTLRYRGHPRVVPGIIVTHVRAGVAHGYITHASAAEFTAALARQLASDHARGSYGTRGLFAGQLSIGLAGRSPARARAGTSLHTVTVSGTNLAGKPDTGDLVFVDNVDSSGAPGTGIESFNHCTATFTVPSGTYWAAGMFAQFSRHGNIIAARLDVLPQFTVSADTTAHISAAAASSKVTMITPRPAISRTPTVTVVRSGTRRSASGPSSLTLQALNVPLWVSPISRPPGRGRLQVSARLSPKPSVIKFVVTASRAGKLYRLSATSRDVYTWHTRPRPGATIPAPWLCDFALGPVSADRHCAVQPMMTLDYSVAGLTANGTTKPGHQAITIDVGHVQPAPPSPIASTRVQVSFDHGKTWRAAQVTHLSGGRFRAVFTAPPNTAVTLRTNGTDTARGTITETITNAYQTGR